MCPCVSADFLACNTRVAHCSFIVPHLKNGYMQCLFYSNVQKKAARMKVPAEAVLDGSPVKKKKRKSLHGVRRPRGSR